MPDKRTPGVLLESSFDLGSFRICSPGTFAAACDDQKDLLRTVFELLQTRAGINHGSVVVSRLDGPGWGFVAQVVFPQGFEKEEDADIADELLVGFEEGVSWLRGSR